MRKLSLLLIAFCLLAPSLRAAEPPTPDACEEKLNEKWVQLLEDLKRVETLFMEKEWRMLKYWETVYNPLWKAGVQAQDEYSEARKAEGLMLQKRYNELSESYLALAEESGADLKKKIKAMRRALKELPKCCDSADFRICIGPRRLDIETRLEDLTKFLAVLRTEEIEFSSRMRAALEEKPSDHDDLAGRYYERLTKWETATKIKLLGKLRDIREKLEVNWPGETCCKMCTPSGQSVSDDPVLAAVRPDPQGNKGVQGQIVNNSSVIEAFDRYEKEKKGQIRS